MNRWRKMGTAPLDGTVILATDGATVTTVYYRDWPAAFRYSVWQLVECGSYADDGDYDPIAWMPCPVPPKPRKAKGAT